MEYGYSKSWYWRSAYCHYVNYNGSVWFECRQERSKNSRNHKNVLQSHEYMWQLKKLNIVSLRVVISVVLWKFDSRYEILNLIAGSWDSMTTTVWGSDEVWLKCNVFNVVDISDTVYRYCVIWGKHWLLGSLKRMRSVMELECDRISSTFDLCNYGELNEKSEIKITINDLSGFCRTGAHLFSTNLGSVKEIVNVGNPGYLLGCRRVSFEIVIVSLISNICGGLWKGKVY